jgi:hypothetical protein
MSTETSTRNVYYKDEDFCVEFEFYNGGLLLHCTVNRISPSILKLGYQVFANIGIEASEAGLSRMFTVTPNPKFARMFGGTSVNKFTLNDIEYEVIEWALKPQPWQRSVLEQPL